MTYEEYKAHFDGYEIKGPTLYHLWEKGVSVDEATERMAACAPRGKNRKRAMSDALLCRRLAGAMLVFAYEMKKHRLTEEQIKFIDNLEIRANKIYRPWEGAASRAAS